MSETKTTRLPAALAERLNGMPMSEREALIARALDARPESLVDTPAAGVETETKVALPEPVAELAGDSSGESPASSVPSKTFWSTGRNGLGERVEWLGAVVHLPGDCAWFLQLDDASRADAVRRALSRCREVVAEREALSESVINPGGYERPRGIPQSWEPVAVWVPAKDSGLTGTLQDAAEAALDADRVAALIAEQAAARAAKKAAEGRA